MFGGKTFVELITALVHDSLCGLADGEHGQSGEDKGEQGTNQDTGQDHRVEEAEVEAEMPPCSDEETTSEDMVAVSNMVNETANETGRTRWWRAAK